MPPVTFSARYLPLRSSYSLSNSTRSPSRSALPSLMPEKWQKTSSPPLSGLMNPKPRSFHRPAMPFSRPPPPPPRPPRSSYRSRERSRSSRLPRERERERERPPSLGGERPPRERERERERERRRSSLSPIVMRALGSDSGAFT